MGGCGIRSCEFVSHRETVIGKRFYWNGGSENYAKEPLAMMGFWYNPSLPVENSKIVFLTKPACVFRLRAS